MNTSKYEVMFQPQFKVAAGLDIHKDTIQLFKCNNTGKEVVEKEFGTFSRDFEELSRLLVKEEVEMVLMESTGIYWIGLYRILKRNNINVVVSNPYKVKQIPMEKTDRKDARWLCKLGMNNMVKDSFIPGEIQYQLREYCRFREKYNKQMTASQNRIVKIIERANIKIRSVSSSIRTKSCQLIIDALISGQTDPKVLAQMCKGRLRSKIPQMELALEGSLSDTDISMLKMLNQDIKHFKNQLDRIEKSLENLITKHYEKADKLLKRVSGIGTKSSQSILGEMGIDMDQFRNADHLSAWAGLAPGNKESAKKRKDVKTRKGNTNLKTTMIRVAWSAVRTKGSYWSCLHAELKKRGKSAQKAIVAVARRMLKLIYRILLEGLEYVEGGVKLYYYHKEKRKAYLQSINIVK